MSGDPRTDRSYVALQLDALSSAQTSAGAGALFTGARAVSVDAWIRFNGLPANVVAIGQQGVFTFGSQGASIYFQFAGMPMILSDPGQPGLEDDSWHHLCATFDGAMVRLYLDGQFNSGQSCMGQVAAGTSPVVIGQGLQGLVRRVRVFNTVLSANAVLDGMYGLPPAGSVAVDLDFTVNPAVDRGPSAFPITIQNNATAIRVSPAVSLGTVGFIRPMGERSTNPGGAQVDPYTVQTWVFIASASNPIQAIFVNSDLDLDTGMALYVQIDPTVSKFRLVSQRGSDLGSGQTLSSSGTIPIGVWTNVATTFDGTTLSLYLDGVLDSTKACPPIPLYSQFSDLVIGAGIVDRIASATMTLQGYMREVDVWSTALGVADIQANMAAPPDTAAAGLSAAYVFTNNPARDQVKGHPIGLAEGAVLSGQLGQAPPTALAAPAAEEAPLPEMGLDPALMARIRSELDFRAFHDANSDAFDAAEASDVALFTDTGHRALIASAWQETRRKLVEDPTSLRLIFTRHRIDGDHVLIAHRPAGSYVACRVSADTIDDCTMWRISLIFIIVAGVIDVFTGVSATLGDKAIALIRRALANPRILALLAMGQLMTAGALFTILREVYDVGLLRPIILAVIEVGFWTLIRIVANLLLIAVGTGAAAARTIASLVATAATFIFTYSQKPASCDPLPRVSLASIAFDYDPTNAAVEALTIRRNFANDVAVPEWVPGRALPADAPCCYAIASVSGATPTIKIMLNIPQATTHAVRIQAIGGGILGAIDPVAAIFTGTVAALILPLSHHGLAGGGVQRQDVTWTWQYQIDGGAWTTCATTQHRVYVVLAIPAQPWQQGGLRSNQQLPWTDVLDYSCTWAAGATTIDLALQKITTSVNSAINLTYDLSQGASFYTRHVAGVSTFLCTEFVSFLTTGGGRGRIVNCTDCATIVTSFANIVGASVFASIMQDPHDNGFACNQILAIGNTTWAVPFGTGFSYHEVPWTGTGTYPDMMYDACLQYDAGPDPWGSGPHTAGLPVKVPFSASGASPIPFVPFIPPLTVPTYCQRLAANTPAGIPACVPTGPRESSNSGRRPVV